MQGPRWKPNEIEYLTENYAKLNIAEMSKHLHRNYNAITLKASRMGLKRPQWNYVNENFFSVYTPKSCYIAGFIAADGCMRSNRNMLQIVIHKKDVEILKWILLVMQATHKIKTRKNKFVSIIIGNQKLAVDLKHNFNITNRKSLTLQYPTQLPENMHRHFARGYFDGDGWFTIRKRKYQYLAGGLTSTLWFLNDFRDIFYKQTQVLLRNPVLNISKIYGCNGITASISFSASKSITFAKWIYKDSPFHLSRKYKLAESYITG